jgi:hypothetical protein
VYLYTPQRPSGEKGGSMKHDSMKTELSADDHQKVVDLSNVVADGEAVVITRHYQSLHTVPTDYQRTKAIVAAILFAGGTSKYNTVETAVKAAGELLAEATK